VILNSTNYFIKKLIYIFLLFLAIHRIVNADETIILICTTDTIKKK